MAKTPVQLQQVDQTLAAQLGSFVNLSKVDAPFTTVVKRALCTDFSNDLMPRLGIERMMFTSIKEVQGEVGSTGQRVFKPMNDFHDQVRFVGAWVNLLDNNGVRPHSPISGDYVEVSFYGTGLNMLHFQDTASRTYNVFVDNQAVAGVTVIGPTFLNNRNYGNNHIVPVVRGLALGFHTVRIASNVNPQFVIYGVEILNESTSLKTSPGTAYIGGKKVSLAALDSQAYNTVDTGSIHSTKGGRVRTYIDSEGAIKKAGTPTDNTASTTLLNVDHTNEEEGRRYNYREFGSGRTDDFAQTTEVSTDRSFTLDDGTTSLTGSDIDFSPSAGGALRLPSTVNRTLRLTFIGTGLDIVEQEQSAAAINIEVRVNATLVGSITTGSTTRRITKIASGLPYGTHVVQFTCTVGSTFALHEFITYVPKKPSIPSDSVELAEYFVMATTDSSATESSLSISSGVLRKMPIREAYWSGAGWAIAGADPDSPLMGFAIDATGGGEVGHYVEYTFLGTGLDFRINSESNATYTISVDGATNFTVSNGDFWSGALTTSNSGGALSFTPSTGVISGNTGIARITLKGMNFVRHTIRVTLTTSTGGGLYPEAFDIITPIHSPKFNGPGVIQGILNVGSESVGDKRVFAEGSDSDEPNWAQSYGITSGPGTAVTTSFGTPLQEMIVPIKTTGRPVLISYSVRVRTDSAGADTATQLYVNNVAVGASKSALSNASNDDYTIADSFIVPLAAGNHVIQIFWFVTAGNGLSPGTGRNLLVREL